MRHIKSIIKYYKDINIHQPVVLTLPWPSSRLIRWGWCVSRLPTASRIWMLCERRFPAGCWLHVSKGFGEITSSPHHAIGFCRGIWEYDDLCCNFAFTLAWSTGKPPWCIYFFILVSQDCTNMMCSCLILSRLYRSDHLYRQSLSNPFQLCIFLYCKLALELFDSCARDLGKLPRN